MKRCFGVLVVGYLLAGCGPTQGKCGLTEEEVQNDVSCSDREPSGEAGASSGEAGAASGDGGSGGGSISPVSAQGAFRFTVMPASPQPAGTACPTNAFTSSVPDTTSAPAEALDEDNYLHKVIDGEQGAAFSCRVAPVSDGFEFEAEIRLGVRALRFEGGTLSAERTGNATVTVIDSQYLSPAALTSSEPCLVNAAKSAGNNYQVKAGSMWAEFTCAAVEALPTSSCAANGVFVLENCEGLVLAE